MHFTDNPARLRRDAGFMKLITFFVIVGIAYAGFLLFIASSPDMLEQSMASRPIENPSDLIPELQMHSRMNTPDGPMTKKFVKSKDYRIRGEIHKVIEMSEFVKEKNNTTVFILCRNGKIMSASRTENADYYFVRVDKKEVRMKHFKPGKTLEVIHSKDINSQLNSRNIHYFFAPKSTYLARNRR